MPKKKTGFSKTNFMKTALFQPGKKAVKATKKGLKICGKSAEKTADLMAIKTTLDAVGIKDLNKRKEARKIMLNHFGQLKFMAKPGKRQPDFATKQRLKIRAINQLINLLGKDSANKIIGILVLAEIKRKSVLKELKRKTIRERFTDKKKK